MLTSDAAQRIGRLLLEEEGDPIRVHPAGLRARPVALGIFLGIALATLHAAVTTGSFAARASVSPAVPPDRSEELTMPTSTTRAAMASAVALSVVASASAQDAVQWRVEDGGNGHWYARNSTPLTWEQASLAAAALRGGLASTTTSAELGFIRIHLINDRMVCWLGATIDCSQANGECCDACTWRWTSGEPFDVSWSGWIGDNAFTTERLVTNGVGFDDMCSPCSVQDFRPPSIIEWSADCNNDGLVDYGQIRAGDLADANGNNIPDCCEPGAGACPGDLVRDGRVDGVDLAAVLNNWGLSEGAALNADANCDGVVDGQDLATVLGSWGKCP